MAEIVIYLGFAALFTDLFWRGKKMKRIIVFVLVSVCFSGFAFGDIDSGLVG